MSRFGTGFGFNKYNASLWGGGTEVFNANVAEFDGTNYLSTPNSSPLQIAGTKMSLSIRVKPTSLATSWCMLIANQGGVQADGGFLVQYIRTTNVINFAPRINGSQVILASPASALTLNAWNTVTCVKDTSELRMYINGAHVATGATSGNMTARTAGLLTIGESPDGAGDPHEGSLEQALIWDGVSLDDAQALDLHNIGVAKCWDLLGDLQTGVVYAPSLAEWTGNVGNGLVDNSPSGLVTTNNNAVTFTGTAQIECNA